MYSFRVLFAAIFLAAGSALAGAPQDIRFNRDIRPILSENCFACHGPDSTHRKEGLRFDRKEGLLEKREHGFVVVPGKPGESMMIGRINSTDPDEIMPPVKSGKTLTPAQKQTLAKWIEQGANWEPFWSFVAPTRPELPPVHKVQWCKNGIDRFILARLDDEGLQPAEEADRRALIRRVTFDLIGLPPTPQEVDDYVNDHFPNAYEKVVDRLLANPHYGEHQAQYWLDAARYGDTHGIHIDNYREIWPYRDWVIEAFNRNEPFDQFTVDQIAGDLELNATLEQRIATGFNRCNITTSEGGSIPDEVAAMYAKDRVETLGAVWLGLTTGCAVCHDHKFDPISQKDFYQFTAFFRNTTQKPLDGNVKDTPPNMVVPKPADRANWEKYLAEFGKIKDQQRALLEEAGKPFDAWAKGPVAKSLKQPLDPKDEQLAIDFDEGKGNKLAVALHGEEKSVELPEGLKWGNGPLKEKNSALEFGPKQSISIAKAGDFDADQPFSMGGWVFLPKQEGTYLIASKFDDSVKGQKPGWVLQLEDRIPVFRMVGKSAGDSLQVRAINSLRLKGGTWNHIFVTYDGSRNLDGLQLYVNGEPRNTEEVDEKSLQESIRNAGTLRFGSDGQRDFHGGGLADFRIYSRELDALEVGVVSKWNELRAALVRADGKLSGPERKDLQQLYLMRFDEPYHTVVAELAKIDSQQRVIRRRSPITLVMAENPKSEPTARILYRGQYDQPKDTVKAETPEFLPPMPRDAPHNRLGLATWLVDKSNPLTARVTVNRMWQQLFGQGLVRTPGDFGIMGEAPSHPLLLDWLAVEFQEPSNHSDVAWDMKRMMKLMVMSATYRQAAIVSPEKLQKDPENRLLARGPRYRLEAEDLRDSALAASGLLVDTIGGPSVKPYQPPGLWEEVAMNGSNTRNYVQDKGTNLYRRSIYTFWKRAAPPASMDILNAPTRETCVVRRERTDTPLQALVVMNDPQWVEAARVLATHAMQAVPSDFDQRLDFITTRVISRPMEARERGICRTSLADFLQNYQLHPDDAKKLLATGESKPDDKLNPSELAAWTMLASEIMNLDEALNK